MEPRQRAPAAQHGRKARGNHRRALAPRALVRQIERRSPTLVRPRMHSPAHYKIAPCPNSLIARAESSSHEPSWERETTTRAPLAPEGTVMPFTWYDCP